MIRSTRTRGHRLIAAVVGALALLPSSASAGLPGTSSAPAQQEPDRDTGSDGPATIRLVQQDAVVAPDGDFTVFLEVDDAPDGSDLAIDIYPVIDDSDLLDDAVSGELSNSEATFPVVDLPVPSASTTVQSGFSIDVYAPGEQSPGGGWAKRLSEPGVYPVRVRLRGPDNQTIATLVTFLVRAAEDAAELTPAMVALVPEAALDTTPQESVDHAAEPLSDDDLNRIETLIDTFSEHPDVPASFSISPDVARRLELTASSGEGTGGTDAGQGPEGDGDGTTSTTGGSASTTGDPGPDDAPADLLERFRSALGGDDREVLGAPFVDVDPAELVGAGLTTELAIQQRTGFRDLADVLEPPVGDTWAVGRRLDPDTVDALADLGVTNLLVAPAAFSEPPPDLPVRVDGTTGGSRLVVRDPALSTGGNPDPVLAAHRLIGQTIARSMIGERAPQLISIPAPETVEDVAEIDALLSVLADSEEVVQATTVSQLLRSSMTEAERAALAEPDLAPIGSYPEDLRSSRALVDSFATMIPDDPDLAAQQGESLSRSATAGLSRAARSEIVDEVRGAVEAHFDAVSIPRSDRVTLGARDAQFPLVISSESDIPLLVLVSLTSASDRLTVKQDRVEVLLDSDRTVVPIQVHSRSPGDTPIRIVVTTLDGQVILSEGTYSIRSTAVSGVGLLLTVGAGLFLALWWGRHFVRARRSKARHAR